MTILRRRRFLMSWVFIGTLFLVVLIASFFPERYRSAALIFIESPEVRGDLVRTTYETASTDLRIDRMRVRVTRNENLIPIIEELGLYPDEPAEDRPGFMRGDIDTPKVVNNNRSDNVLMGAETIGFQVAFRHENAEIAQEVAARLADLFLRENIAARTETVTETSNVLAAQAQALEAELARTEVALAEFKRANAGRLPEDADLNSQLLDRTQRDLDAVEREIRTLQERKNLLMAQLARTSRSAPIFDENGTPILGAEDRLEQLRREYVTLSARYSQEHPQLSALRREIALLDQRGATGTSAETLQMEIDARSAELRQLRERYADEHPEIRSLQRTIEGLQKQLETAPRRSEQASQRPPTNPEYVELQVQVDGVDTELAALRREREAFRQRIDEYEARISRTPETEREFTMLTRDYEIARQDYDEIRQKQAEAERAVGIEEQQRAERYVLQSPAYLPTSPAQPNRLTLLIVGIFLGGTAAVAAGLFREAVDTTVRGARDLRSMLTAPPIAVIPLIETVRDTRYRLLRRTALAASFVGVAAFSFNLIA